MRQNFLQYLRASETDRGRLGATLDQPVFTPEGLSEPQFRTVPKNPNTLYRQNMSEAMRLYDRVLRGDRWAALRFQEALTMSDFPQYFGDILDRSVLANYMETPYSWSTYAKRARIRDFRQAKIFRFDRGAGVLNGPIVPNSYGATGTGPDGISQLTEYPMRYREDAQYTDQLLKYGARMDFAWEVMVNDDLDALRDTPALFGRAARRTEEKNATQLYVSSTGPNSTFFSAGNLNVVTSAVNSVVTTNNPPLSITSLAWALIIAASQLDLDGEPISIEMYTLVVPPALDITARNIVNAVQIWMNDQGGTIGNDGSLQRLLTQNWAAGRVRPVVNYYLPIVNTTSGNTAWYLFAQPTGRPAMQLSFLMGREAPELFMKAPNAIPIGEGRMGPGAGATVGTTMSNPMDGDFDTDSIMYKVRHILGGTLLDPKMAVASNGSGS